MSLKGPSRVTGEDLWPYVTGERTNRRDYVVQAYGWIAAVRTAEWNYSAIWNRERYVGDYKPQLYDRRKDPDELHTVAEENPAVVKELQKKLEEYIASGREITNGSFSELRLRGFKPDGRAVEVAADLAALITVQTGHRK